MGLPRVTPAESKADSCVAVAGVSLCSSHFLGTNDISQSLSFCELQVLSTDTASTQLGLFLPSLF